MRKRKQRLIPNLIFLCLISTSIITTLTVAKYQSTITSSNSAKVASFVVDAIGNGSNKIDINCNENKYTTSYEIVVTNEKDEKVSEISMKYNIIVEFSTALPKDVTISIGDKTYNGGEKIYTFENIGKFEAGKAESKTHTISITTSSSIKDNYSSSMTVSVYTEQID